MKSFFLGWVGLLAGSVFAQDRDIMPRPPRPAPPDNALVAIVRNTRVGDPIRYRNLVVYPLYMSDRARGGYWTMDEALVRGVLRITEKGEGSVPHLLVENRADDPVFLMAGEIVTGGKQNRVISQDILIPPRSGPISLSVFCVEKGRWTKSADHFDAEREMAHSNLRQHLNVAPSQAGVWDEVSRKATAVAPGAAEGTAYLGRIFEDREVRREVDDYWRRIRLPRDANGMAVMMGGRVVGAELFGDSETFAKLQDKLLRSYAADAIECRFAEEGGWDDSARVERFLRRVESARISPQETVGIGRLFRVQGGGLYGSMLMWHKQRGAFGVVHVSLFDESPVVGR